MLYPDLGRLSLAQGCATGGTNDHEAGGSNDPPRPPPPKRGTGSDGNSPAYEDPVEAAFEVPDIVRMMLEQVASGQEAVDACRDVVRMCASSNAFGPVCNDDATWLAMTARVFGPKVRAPNPDLGEPTEPKKWFAFLCQQHVVAERLADELFAIEVGDENEAAMLPMLEMLSNAALSRYRDAPSNETLRAWQRASFEHRLGKLLARSKLRSAEYRRKYYEWAQQQRLVLELKGNRLLKPIGSKRAYSTKPERRKSQVLLWFWLPRAMARARERANRKAADGVA